MTPIVLKKTTFGDIQDAQEDDGEDSYLKSDAKPPADSASVLTRGAKADEPEPAEQAPLPEAERVTRSRVRLGKAQLLPQTAIRN